MINEEIQVIPVQKNEKMTVSEEILCSSCGCVMCKCTLEDGVIKDDSYYDITYNHNDWGNDSVESFITGQVCSKQCLYQWLDKIWDTDIDGQDTPHIEIRKVNNRAASTNRHMDAARTAKKLSQKQLRIKTIVGGIKHDCS